MEQSLSLSSRPFAVITGACSGIGLDLAKQFAENGYDLLVAAKTEDVFDAVEGLEKYGIDVECIEVDLSTYNGVEVLLDAIHASQRSVEVLVLNAHEGSEGEFSTTRFKDEIGLINLNVMSLVNLTKRLLPEMYENEFGRILYVTPNSVEVVSQGIKGFIQSFADGLRSEAKAHGVSVTTLPFEPAVAPELLALHAYEAVMSGAENVLSSTLKERLHGWANKVMPVLRKPFQDHGQQVE